MSFQIVPVPRALLNMISLVQSAQEVKAASKRISTLTDIVVDLFQNLPQQDRARAKLQCHACLIYCASMAGAATKVVDDTPVSRITFVLNTMSGLMQGVAKYQERLNAHGDANAAIGDACFNAYLNGAQVRFIEIHA